MSTEGSRKYGDEQRKQELIAGLRDVRQRILALASSLPVSKRDQVFLGSWSCDELLAHLAGWDNANMDAANEVLAGNTPSFYAYQDRDWSAFNAMLVTAYQRDDFEELIEFVHGTHRKLLALLQEIPADELWKDRGIRARGWKVTIGRLLEAERKDEEEHYLQLKEFIDAGPQ